jgi:hypothetical protein
MRLRAKQKTLKPTLQGSFLRRSTNTRQAQLAARELAFLMPAIKMASGAMSTPRS